MGCYIAFNFTGLRPWLAMPSMQAGGARHPCKDFPEQFLPCRRAPVLRPHLLHLGALPLAAKCICLFAREAWIFRVIIDTGMLLPVPKTWRASHKTGINLAASDKSLIRWTLGECPQHYSGAWTSLPDAADSTVFEAPGICSPSETRVMLRNSTRTASAVVHPELHVQVRQLACATHKRS